MRILQTARWFFPHHGGGTIRTYQTAKNLVELGNEVHLLVHHPKSIPHVTLDCEVKKYEKVEGIHVYRLPYIGPRYLYYSIVIPLMAFYAIRIIRKNKIEIILSHNPPYLVGAASWIASKVTGIPLVLNVHDLWGTSHYSKFELEVGLFLEKFTCRRAKKIFIASKENIAILAERVGNLAPWIGIKYLIEAAPHILKKHDAHFVIVGNGIELSKLKKRSKELKIDKNITFTGVVPYSILPKLMNLADVCVSTFPKPETVGRTQATTPHNCTEYMARAKAVVSTDARKFKEFIIDQETGLLVPPEDPTAMAEGVIKLLGNDELRNKLGKNGRRFVKEYFNREKI